MAALAVGMVEGDVMQKATTGGNAITVRLNPHLDGETILESNDPWYRWLRATAELFLSGEIDANELSGMIVEIVDDRGTFDPAGRQLYGSLMLAWGEPSCICIANWEGPPCIRGCEPLDRRARLRELMGL